MQSFLKKKFNIVSYSLKLSTESIANFEISKNFEFKKVGPNLHVSSIFYNNNSNLIQTINHFIYVYESNKNRLEIKEKLLIIHKYYSEF